MRVDVAQVVESLGIQTKRSGRLYWASCPKRFNEQGKEEPHRDSDASWRIILDADDDRYGQHRCYGCGFGGYAVHLVQGVLGCSKQEAGEWLKSFETGDLIPKVVDVVEIESMVFRSQFRLPDGVEFGDPSTWPKSARRYAENRGVTVDQIARWGIGYAAEARLSGRLVFPVYTRERRLISYTGRSFIGAAVRYKNARLEDGADMAAIWGEAEWPAPRPDGKPEGVVVVCEGALNALACERVLPAGVNVGALFGSQLWPEHVLKLARFSTVVIATDEDPAGTKVANALFEQLHRSTECVRLELPPGEDCNDLPAEDLRERLVDVLSR